MYNEGLGVPNNLLTSSYCVPIFKNLMQGYFHSQRDMQTCRTSLKCCLPGCAEAGAPTGVLAQGLVSRAGRAGGRTGGLAVAAAAAAATATEKAGAVPFTTANKRQKLVQASSCVGRRGPIFLLDMHNITVQLISSLYKC